MSNQFPLSRIVAGLSLAAVLLTLALLSSGHPHDADAASSPSDNGKTNQLPFSTPTPIPTPVIAVGGSTNDYQPSLVRRADGSFLMAFFRYDSADIYVTSSSVDGLTWSTPVAAIATSASEGTPSLLQLHDGSYLLLYQISESFSSSHIYRSTSPDGLTWTAQGQVQLGWSSESPGISRAIVESDGSVTMVYFVSSNGSNLGTFIAHSTDGGVTWDQNRTLVVNGVNARIAKSDAGLYYVTFTVGSSSNHNVFIKSSLDRVNWSPTVQVSYSKGSDGQAVPVGNRVAVFYSSRYGVEAANIYYRIADEALNFANEKEFTFDKTLPTTTSSLMWSRFLAATA
ncbi:MAG: hypothetical protein DLM69_03230 [Candidatus Chloroheliales bacterium]|nr:MAG: hypothetical protein DLM69_03230 [Chloroflexota bacterium]